MSHASPEVHRFLATLDHPLKAGVEQLRAGILAADPGITEHVTWNAPSYRYGGEDRVTFRLQPRDQLQLVLQRRTGPGRRGGVRLHRPTGLVAWRTPDRGVVTFPDLAPVSAVETAVPVLVRAWIAA